MKRFVVVAVLLLAACSGQRATREQPPPSLPKYDPEHSIIDRILGPQPPPAPTAVPPGIAQSALELVSNSAKAKRVYAEGLVVFQSSPKEAMRLLGEAVALDPKNADYRNSYGAILANGRLYDQAASEFREALRLRPNYPKASANLTRTMQEIESRQASEIRSQLDSR